ncbi:MAG: tetratricopeptide repeat protein, partial [Rhodobacteraceae bacterium]|nr:tetratricopeptide repeat protein [Paracoccaceae bacterium]
MKVERIHVMFCDDIRLEVGGKLILIGVYGSELAVDEFPKDLELTIFIRVFEPETGPINLQISVNGKDLFRINHAMDVQENTAQSDIFLQDVPIHVEEESVLSVSKTLNGEETANLGSLIIKQRHVAQQTVAQIRFTAEDAASLEAQQKAQETKKSGVVGIVDLAVIEALELQRNEQVQEAIAKWEAIANIVGHTNKDQAARAYFSIGYLYMTSFSVIAVSKEEALDRAIASYDEAVRLDPNNAAAYNNRGIAKKEMGRHEEAIADYDEAVRL